MLLLSSLFAYSLTSYDFLFISSPCSARLMLLCPSHSRLMLHERLRWWRRGWALAYQAAVSGLIPALDLNRFSSSVYVTLNLDVGFSNSFFLYTLLGQQCFTIPSSPLPLTPSCTKFSIGLSLHQHKFAALSFHWNIKNCLMISNTWTFNRRHLNVFLRLFWPKLLN